MVEICEDESIIRAMVIDDREMFDRLSFDGLPEDTNPMHRGIWIKWTNKEGIIEALGCFSASSIFTLSVHIHIPKEFRGKGTVKKGNDFLRWIASRSKGRHIKFETSVPEDRRDVLLYTMRLGFKREGISRQSIIKKGVVMDMYNMGITFEEVINGRI